MEMQDGIFYRDGTLLPSKYDRLIKVRQGKTSIKPHVAIDLEDCYFHSRSVAAQYTMGGGGKSMDTRIPFVGEKSGLFLYRIIPKYYYYFDGAISQRIVGRVQQKLFKFTSFQNKIRKKYFLFIKFNYLRDINRCLVYHFLLRESFRIS
jgi:hypothetical protein